MRLLAAPLLLAGTWAVPALAQPDPHLHHQHHNHQQHSAPASPRPGSASHGSHGHGSHSHELGPAGATYDLRWLDAMVQHHTGALRMSEFVFNVGSPGIGALATSIWRDQAREISAMNRWRRAWYPEAPAYPLALRPGGDPNTMAGLERMTPAQIEAMRMMAEMPSRDNRVVWFLEGMLMHHGGALEMAHDALEKSTNPSVRRLAREIIVAQRREILELRRMLRHEGLDKPDYRQFDSLFSF
ncbi:DUF305 domain-containing protein [Cyanobium sp. CH-040]|uniref:DUF305 domain-containing protein n=1 Tax=Cyanobium sp. CH-040 TaxID=2823708 RepID=UPI0020CE6F29|nr:DUF305 domain-containing protein [Cyanobium sp. CH-040]MCP9928470.1 DUF305 domain-containing protein [Cyanobium sp. CH-040]